MNGILGMTHILAGTTLDEKQRYYVQTIQKSAENLLLILNDILDLSKLEAGKMSLKPTKFYLRQTLQQLKDLFSTIILQKKLNFSVVVADDVPLYVMADENRLVQVLTNLVSNAVKFTEQGGITIDVKNILYLKDYLILKITVIDTGAGISKQFLGQLFDKFFQIDLQNTKQQGTGLGLSICKQLVELWGGEIGVESQIGKGSSFWFTIPMQILPIQDTENLSAITTQKFDFQNITVLLVEDVAVNQEVAKIILEQLGCEVELANHGEEAVNKVKQKDYDLIFMDIMMPIMDGVEATSIIKKLKPHTVVIGLSANVMEDDAQKYIDLGMNDYLSKPIAPLQISEKILKWLPHKVRSLEAQNLPTTAQYQTSDWLNLKVIEQLKNFTKNNPTKLKIIATSFEEELAKLLQSIKENCIIGQYTVVTNHLHTLKGLTATIGASALHDLIKEYYDAARQQNFERILTEQNQLYHLFEQTVEALRKEIEA
jgi:CheY-like chemotaxis protein